MPLPSPAAGCTLRAMLGRLLSGGFFVNCNYVSHGIQWVSCRRYARLSNTPNGSTACVTGRQRLALIIRIRRLSLGNPGDARAVGQGVSELRIDYGPGYRVYFKRRGELVVILLAGGDKRTQERDIKLAIELARDLGDYHGKN